MIGSENEIKIVNEDCRETLRRLPAHSIDLMLQDPPYGVTLNQWDKRPNLREMWPEWLRVIKNNGAIIFFSQQPFTSELVTSNKGLFRYDLIWYKPRCSGFLNAKKMPLRNHEHLLVFYKKLPKYNPQMGIGSKIKMVRDCNRLGSNYGKPSSGSKLYDSQGKRYPQSVIEFSTGHSRKFHPTQKPLELIRYLVKTYSLARDLVFDGYSGAGTTAAACLLEQRRFVGSEINLKYYQYSIKRIEDLAAGRKN